jgi:hypothetical protein
VAVDPAERDRGLERLGVLETLDALLGEREPRALGRRGMVALEPRLPVGAGVEDDRVGHRATV